ncbi:MAG: TetR/AcrR family transcriptional regulator [Parasphingorhabdus sp.]
MAGVTTISTKTAIMNAAENAVRRRGYNGFSLDEVACEVGIQKSSIYYHYSSKSDLIAALLKRFSGQISSFLEHVADTESRAGDRLMAYILETRSLIEEGDSICLSVALNIDQQSLQAKIVNDLALFHRINIDWLAATFKLGLQDGSIIDIGNPAEEANACLALVDGAQLIARAHQNSKLYDEATRLLRSRIVGANAKDIAH